MASSIAVKRIFNDQIRLERESLNPHGIYHVFDENNLYSAKAMMIGPSDTPYENGYYFFDITFPENYPFSPPAVKFCSTDGYIRFNPNLYANGKVCLSVINTWAGPSWTSCQNLSSVLLSIQSLLNKHPLQNEPGYETCVDSKSVNYNKYIKHEVMRFAIYNLLKTPPAGFECFHHIMRDHFVKNIDWHKNQLIELSSSVTEPDIASGVYNLTVKNSYSDLIKCIDTLYCNFIGDDITKLNISQSNT
jgi:ubiquitin-conjugating enzyme E2 Z